MKKFVSGIIAGLLITLSVNVFAHPGRLDSQGGHNKRADATYHYHVGNDRINEYDTPQSSVPAAPKASETPAVQAAPQAPAVQAVPQAPAAPTVPVPSGLRAEYNSNKITINGVPLDLSRPLVNIYDETETATNYMPLRDVLEALGYTVGWDNQTQTVVITSPVN